MSFISPLVSIVIPVYNSAAYLRRCLESVLNQTLDNIEIICVNDGSTDNSLEILHEYAVMDSRIKVLSIAHGGPGNARNLALEHCKGVWITGLDSDDYLEFDACSYVISHADDGVDVIQYGAKMKLDNLNEILLPCLKNGIYAVTSYILISHSCEFWGKFWRKSFIDKYQCKFPEGLWYEDWFFYWAYLPMANRILYLPECKYIREQRTDSIMGLSRNRVSRVLDHVRVLEKLLNFRLEHPVAKLFRGVNLINFVQCIRFVESHLSANTLACANDMFRKYAQHPLMKPHRIWLKAYDNSIKQTKYFIRSKPAEFHIGIFKWFPLRIAVEGCYVVFRLFGRRFFRYKL